MASNSCLLVVTLLIFSSHKLSAQEASPTVAVCLTGQARDIQITGASILRHVLTNWEKNVDLFLSIALDEGAYKIATLASHPRIVAIRIGPAIAINQSHYKYSNEDMPQGFLQHFQHIARCNTLLEQHRELTGKTYDWVLRTRPDGFWFEPPPPVKTLQPGTYTVPGGSHWRGINDRLSITNYADALRSFDRLATMNQLHDSGVVFQSTENLLMKHLELLKIPHSFKNLSFCVVSRRIKFWEHRFVPVFSLTSGGPLNGAYCRVCVPRAVDIDAIQYIKNLKRKERATVGPVKNPVLCNASVPWDRNWRSTFDRQMPDEYGESRQRIEDMSRDECISIFQKMRKSAVVWQAPSPLSICIRRELGSEFDFGTGNYSFPTTLGLLNDLKYSKIVSFIADEGWDLSWERQVMKADPRLTISVFLLNSAAFRQSGSSIASNPPEWQLYKLKEVKDPLLNDSLAFSGETNFGSAVNRGFRFRKNEKSGTRKTFEKCIAVMTLKDKVIDVLKISLPGLESQIFSQLVSQKIVLPVCQLLVRFADRHYPNGEDSLIGPAKQLVELGFTLSHCSRDYVDDSFKCAFYSEFFCQTAKSITNL